MQLLLIAAVYFVVEGYILFWVVGQIGLLQVLLILGASALLGIFLVRSQGLNTIVRANHALFRGESPHEEILDGVALLICGVIFIVPGLLSDVLALFLLIPALRRAVVYRMSWRVARQRSTFPSGGFTGGVNPQNGGASRVRENGSAWASEGDSGGRHGFGRYSGAYGPFIFYRFFMKGDMPRPDIHAPGRSGCSVHERGHFNSNDEYEVIVHDDEQVIDVNPECSPYGGKGSAKSGQ